MLMKRRWGVAPEGRRVGGEGSVEVGCAWASNWNYRLGGSWCSTSDSTALSPDDRFVSIPVLVLDSVLYRRSVIQTGVGASVLSI